jgi:large subunit ribosomal protein L19
MAAKEAGKEKAEKKEKKEKGERAEKPRMEQSGPVKFAIGDNIKVYVRIYEGDKERIQSFSGTVIARKGRGDTEMFTVRRISHGVGVERIFPVRSPHIAKIDVEGSTHVRRAKLYFLRRISGKQAHLEEKIGDSKGEAPAAVPQAAAETK